ncbi:MAG TPA: chromosomal replication initiator protein DnaA [Anaerolineae bacterium]|nr:chromosomal replication initiator protein DnaA [Anaerolineae bacterium]HNU03355.1 chromosomal replication initiator protein DnaA [Anaerolineae bacterium]
MSLATTPTSFDAPLISPHKAWQAALGELQLQVTPDIYEMYLHPTRFMAYEDGAFLIAVPNGFVKDWLDLRLNRVVKNTLRHIFQREVEIKYSVQPYPLRAAEQPAPAPLLDAALLAEPAPASAASINGSSADQGLPLVAAYTFDTFIVGSNNLLAHAASVAVGDRPGGRYNPLFIYSGVGLGKTHLMHAIAHRCRQNGHKAVYVSCEMFTNELVTAIRTNTQEQFRAKYRTSDVLLVDDVQFLAGKPSTQEELFHTFNALHEAGRQVVLACDRPPKAMATLENRLRSRFEWGLITDIQAPDLETRLAILGAKCASHGAVLSNALLERIARLVTTNIRELEGALTKVLAHASLSGVHLTAERIEGILADMVPLKAQLSPDEVLTLVGRYFEINLDDLISPSRKREIVQARQVAMYLLRSELDLSFANIGALFGGRDHATVMHSVEKIEGLVQSDDGVQSAVDSLRARIVAPQPVLERVRV